jgi:RNA polymerase sigma-70 factor (sigma-E family)
MREVFGVRDGSVDVEAEFTAFVVAHERGLRRMAFLICRDRHRAEDIVQNVLVRLFQRWARIERREDLLAYARRAVANAAIDEKRRPWRREQLGHDDVDVPSSPRDQNRHDQSDAALAALDCLSPRQRAVIVLRYVEDLDVETTARVLGITPGTVKSQAARGLATLRAAMTRDQHATDRGGAG